MSTPTNNSLQLTGVNEDVFPEFWTGADDSRSGTPEPWMDRVARHGWGHLEAHIVNHPPYVRMRALDPNFEHFAPSPFVATPHSTVSGWGDGWPEEPAQNDWSVPHQEWLRRQAEEEALAPSERQPETRYFEWPNAVPDEEPLPPSTPPSLSSSTSSISNFEVADIQQPRPRYPVTPIELLINTFEEQEVLLASFRRSSTFDSWEER